jgi:hypothetical protein
MIAVPKDRPHPATPRVLVTKAVVFQPFGIVDGGTYSAIAETICSRSTWLAVPKGAPRRGPSSAGYSRSPAASGASASLKWKLTRAIFLSRIPKTNQMLLSTGTPLFWPRPV